MTKILTENNAKIKKGEKSGWLTVGIHFAPAKLSGREVCPWRSPACSASCLNTAGMGVYSNVQAARIAKTKWFFSDRAGFIMQLVKEICAAQRRATRKGLRLAVRLNLTSDIPWENVQTNVKLSLFDLFPEIQFYDYTKGIERFAKFMRGELPANYHLTFSKSETNAEESERAIALGGNLAVVFHDMLPDTFRGRPVVNGDENDLRFLDPVGVVVGLSAKGKARKDTSGFVLDGSISNPIEKVGANA
jgi:hypothetical protein